MKTIFVVCPIHYTEEEIVAEFLERFCSDESGWMTWHETIEEANGWYNQLPSKKDELAVRTVVLKAIIK